MPPHLVDVRLRPDLAARPQKHPLSSQLEYDTWAELLIKTNHNSFGRHDADPMFGPWVRRPPPSPATAMAEPQPDNSRKQVIESYRPEMVRNMPKEEAEEVAAFELSFRDFVESPQPKKTRPEVAVAAATGDNMEKKSKQRKESRMGTSGLFLIKAFVPLVLAAVGGHRKIAGGGVEKAAKVSPNPGHDKFDERICGNGSSNHSGGGGGRNSGRRASCYLFLHRDRSRPIEI